MNINIEKDQRGELIYSLSKLDWLMARAKKTQRLYDRTQMEVFSILHATFSERLESIDANDARTGVHHAQA